MKFLLRSYGVPSSAQPRGEPNSWDNPIGTIAWTGVPATTCTEITNVVAYKKNCHFLLFNIWYVFRLWFRTASCLGLHQNRRGNRIICGNWQRVSVGLLLLRYHMLAHWLWGIRVMVLLPQQYGYDSYLLRGICTGCLLTSNINDNITCMRAVQIS